MCDMKCMRCVTRLKIKKRAKSPTERNAWNFSFLIGDIFLESVAHAGIPQFQGRTPVYAYTAS